MISISKTKKEFMRRGNSGKLGFPRYFIFLSTLELRIKWSYSNLINTKHYSKWAFDDGAKGAKTTDRHKDGIGIRQNDSLESWYTRKDAAERLCYNDIFHSQYPSRQTKI